MIISEQFHSVSNKEARMQVTKPVEQKKNHKIGRMLDLNLKSTHDTICTHPQNEKLSPFNKLGKIHRKISRKSWSASKEITLK